jgi:hypothetical protein
VLGRGLVCSGMQGNECSIGEDSLCNYVLLVLDEFLYYFFRKSEGKRQDTKHEVIGSKANNDVPSKGSRYDTCR